ncbi:MAG: SDR family NAD(P)-dependent oxidoreductase [Paracoccaceae bacterium]
MITGCSSGIGLEIARELHAASFEVIGISRSKPNLKEPPYRAVLGDLGDPTGVANALSELLQQPSISKCEMVIHCAGALDLVPALEISPVLARRSLQLHFLSVIQLNSQLARVLVKNNGKIIVIGSISAEHTAPLMSLYSSSKAAVKSYIGGLRREVSAVGIQVCYIELGNVATNFSAKATKTVLKPSLSDLNYEPIIINFVGLANRINKRAVDPKTVARKIVKIALRKRVNRNFYFGSGTARSFLFRLLPQCLLDGIYARALGTAERKNEQ